MSVWRQASFRCAIYTYCDKSASHFYKDSNDVVIGLCEEHALSGPTLDRSLVELSDEEVAVHLVMES